MAQWKALAAAFAPFTRAWPRNRFPARLNALSFDQTCIRSMSSIVTGQSGRRYEQREVLREWPQNPERNIYRADSQGQSFVLKPVLSKTKWKVLQMLKEEFPTSQRLRLHVDYNVEERVLVYEYFRHTFWALLREYPEFPSAEIKKILRGTAEAVKEHHGNGWFHLDIKPDNILVDWATDDEGQPRVQKVALGDFDDAFKCPQRENVGDVTWVISNSSGRGVGNVMWRSPEAHAGKGMSKWSDVYSLGLVCIYGLGAGGMIIPNPDAIALHLQPNGLPFETEILIQHFMYFGPLPEGLLRRVNDPEWSKLYQSCSEFAEKLAEAYPGNRFNEGWSKNECWPDLTLEATDMISKMVPLDPDQRVSIDTVLAHPWW